MTDARSRIVLLTSWRGILAMGIVMYHSGWLWCEEITCAGVVCFFVMSGFLLSMRHEPAEIRGHRYLDFVVRRAKRIYPFHWAVFAAYVVVALLSPMPNEHLVWGATVPNLLLVHSFVPVREVFFSFNSKSWFLGSIFFCYVCYPFVAAWLGKMRLRGQLIFFAALLAAYAYLVQFLSPDEVTYGHVCPLFRLIDFSLGVVLYHVYAALKDRPISWGFAQVSVAEIGVIALFVGLWVFSQRWGSPLRANYNDALMWYVPMSLVIFLSALTAGREGLVGKLLLCRPLIWLGEHSLELFMLQGVAGMLYTALVAPFFGHFGVDIYGYYAIGLLPILFLLSWGAHRLFNS